MNNRMAEQMKELVEIKKAMEYYGILFNQRGFAKCPFHEEKTASLSVKNGRFKCFGCGQSGSIIDFVMLYFGLNFGQSLIKINHDFGLRLTNQKPSYREREVLKKQREKRKQQQIEKERCRQRYLKACHFHAVLFRRSLRGPKIDGLIDYLDQLEQWLDEQIEEART